MSIQVAFELEFYLIKADWIPGNPPVLPLSLVSEVEEGQLYALLSLEICGELLKSITDHCRKMDLSADTSVAELSPGQFEVNIIMYRILFFHVNMQCF